MSIIAVGGIGQNGAYLSSVEVLNDGSSQWTLGPELPDEIHSPAIVQDPKGGVILIGGHSKFIRICHLTVSFFKLEVICFGWVLVALLFVLVAHYKTMRSN